MARKQATRSGNRGDVSSARRGFHGVCDGRESRVTVVMRKLSFSAPPPARPLATSHGGYKNSMPIGNIFCSRFNNTWGGVA